MKLRRTFSLVALIILGTTFFSDLRAQDTLVVQTITYDSLSRTGVYQFPPASETQFEKVIMQYRMRCHHALVSDANNRNKGCGEWDYNCETFITDSTRTDSIKQLQPSAIISSFPGNTNFPYTQRPTFTTIRHTEQQALYNGGPTIPRIRIGSGSSKINFPFVASKRAARTLVVIHASELTAAGVNKGPIQGVHFDFALPAAGQRKVIARVRITTGDSPVDQDIRGKGWMNVYASSANDSNLYFYQPFMWDGISNLEFDLGITNAALSKDAQVFTEDAGYAASLNGSTSDSALSFYGYEGVQISPSNFNAITNEVTIACWTKGDSTVLPANSALLEGVDSHNNRSVNVHLPWSDNNIYWDCGDGMTGFDRVNKAAVQANFAGQWNYWAFTKNATTGRMSIYLNGSLFATDTGKRRPIVLTKLNLGTSLTSSLSYYGDVSRFSLWNKALDSNAIKSIMRGDITPNDPNAQNLIAYYKLNEGSGSTFHDSSANHATSTLLGIPVWRAINGTDVFTNFSSNTLRPNLSLIQSLDTSLKPSITTTYTFDTLLDHAHSITRFAIVRDDSVRTLDTAYRWEADTSITKTETGVLLSKKLVAADDTTRITSLSYYQKWPQKFEIMSFVTPYGIGLDLGKDGKLWEFDATDYTPILHGLKRISMERGSGQEEFDIRFLFIRGQPARNVLNIQQIWPMTEEPYQNIASGLRYEPRQVTFDQAAAGFKLRSMITGHGQDGEFVPRTHSVTIGPKTYSWDVYKVCSTNPLYPQGGTWIYNRSGWCPGAPTLETENELTGTVTPGAGRLFSYGVDMSNYPVGDSRYDPSHQLVSYGPPNFSLNAGIVEIERPSDHIAFGRINPACDFPIVVIRNNGSTPLTSLKLDYYVDGGPHRSFAWSGHLNFLDTESVMLPVDSLGFWTSNLTGQFHVDISSPNGGTDEYDHDNHFSSRYTQPPSYSGAIVINFRTNNFPLENSYEVRDLAGNIVYARLDTGTKNTIYFDSLALPVGCYTLTLHDDPDSADGLSFWNNPNQGTGYLRLRQTSKTGKILVTLQPDFGLFSEYDFQIVKSTSGVASAPGGYQIVSLYPNPARDKITLQLEGYQNEHFTFSIVDVLGRVLLTKSRASDASGKLKTSFDIGNLTKGNYLLRMSSSSGSTSKPFVLE